MPTAQQTSESQHKARKDRVVKAILLSIFGGEVVGGDRLVEEELAMRLGVSRTPIREALRELAALGVIWLKPNHGAMVRPFGATQLTEIYHMRRILESEAARLACKTINAKSLKQIRDEMQSTLGVHEHPTDWSERALSLDQQLHDLIARSSQCERLAEEITRYWALAYTIGEAVRNVSQTQDHAIREHTNIIDRLLERDAEGSAKAMSDHIDMRLAAAMSALCPPGGRRVPRPGTSLSTSTPSGSTPTQTPPPPGHRLP